MPLLILAAAGFTYLFEMCILGQIFGGYNCRVKVDWLVSALLLCLAKWCIA
jgi:hypothetical protein